MRRALRGAAALLIASSTMTLVPGPAHAATIVTQTYAYTVGVQTFTVPAGVGSITVTMAGGQGGRGGGDSQGSPTPGGYRGLVTGVIAVTPGQQLTIAVGSGGGTGVSSRGNAAGGAGGLNPLDGYDGAAGGIAGPAGSSGGGGGSGAATVVQVAGIDIVAGGAGGNGGNGQFLAIVGRRAENNHLARPDSTSTVGRAGMNTILACSPGFNCDGGASGAGGGGAQGGEQGIVQYGGASATEYFGFGGYPGANNTAALPNLTAGYEFYAGNSAAGSVTISYDTGTPGAPTSVTGTARSNEVALSWTAPSASGSADITDYVIEYATSAGGTYSVFADGTSTDLAATVTGLTNGTTYYFKVAAVNSYGTGPKSSAMTIGVTPSDVPDAPTIVALVPFDSGIYVNLTPGHTDSPILNYDYRLDAGPWLSAQAPANQITIAGLTNGVSYSVDIRAVNVIGASATSAPASATPRAVPGAPSALVAVAADGTVALSWTAPTSDNGAAVTDYVVQVAPAIGGTYITFSDGTSTTPSATITGLTNATTYYFRVAAVNVVGTGLWSAPTGATPFTIPGVPAITTVAPGDGTLTVDFTAPSDGGSDITSYEYRLGGSGPWQSTGSLASQFVIGALSNGTTYSVSMRAVNAAGASTESSASTGVPRTVPAAPAIAAVALDTGAVSVSFTVGSNGGSAITNFEYSINGGTDWITRSPASVASPLTIGGLVGGETYGVVLRAVNAAGVSVASNQSLVTAKGTPEAPSVSGLVESDRGLTVLFTAPANGGTPITNYEYSLDGGAIWTTRSPASASAPLVLSGLVNGTSYAVSLRAVNAVGSGAASTTIVGTPHTTPSAPTIDADTIVGNDGALDVVFTAPLSDGGSPITDYEYSTDAGVSWRLRTTGYTASPLRITTLSSDGITLLTGGATYPVEIRAVNAVGPGVASAVATGITTTVPAAPVITALDAYDSSAAVRFTNPANGGAAILRFEYRLDGGPWVDTGSLANEFVIAGLNNSSMYTVEVRAVNSVGNGSPSAPETVSVRTTPGAPTIDVVTAGDHTLSVAFTSGPDGGAAITTYQYSTDGGTTWRTRSDGATGSPLLLTNTSGSGAPQLTNGTVYAVQIRAVNDAGAGDASLSQLVAPHGPPSAPTSVALNPGDGRLTVTFTPGSDGGSSITAIEYQLDNGSWVDTGSLNSPFTIAGLTNGTQYNVAVRARNAIGAGAASTTAAATPRTTPTAPGSVVATSADSSTLVSWLPPGSNGGAPISGYVVNVYSVPTDGSPAASCATGGALSCPVLGLTNGASYYVAVAGANAAGVGPASSPRVAVTPLTTPLVSIAALNPGTNDIAVDVNVISTGGAAIITFEYRLDGGAWESASTATEPFTIGGLITGTTYVVEVRAVNVAGTGQASAPASATPRTKPGIPGALVATRGNASVLLSWQAPTSNGGQPITDYVVEYGTNVNGPFTTFTDGVSVATAATVTGLTNGTAYVFRVAAANVAGTGTASGLVAATPLAAPSAPTITSVTAGSQYLQVFRTTPATGGSPITAYEYQLDGGPWQSTTGTSSPLTISGLTNGRTYQVAIRAVNVVGPGSASNTVSAKPFGLPSAVAGFIASPGSGTVALSWDAAADNGSAITAYNIIRWSLASEGSIVASYQTTNTSYTVTGLTNGTTYYFTIEATNAAGTGPRSTPRTSVRVGGIAPAAPTIGAVTVTGNQVTIAWTPGAPGDAAASGFVVQYSANDTTHVTMAMQTSTATSATLQVPSVDVPYSLRVATISSIGAGAFATVRPPLVTTGQVAAIGTASATVDATVHANTSTVASDFELATSLADLGTGAASVVPATPVSVSGATAVATSATLTGLESGTTYYVRARAISANLMSRGVTRTFTTPALVTSSDLNQTYSGAPVQITTVTEPLGLTVTRTFEGIGDTSYPVSATPPSDVGTYRVTTTVVDQLLTGSEVATLTIAPKPATLMVTASDKQFDGTTSASLAFQLAGVIDGDDVAVDAGKVTGTFSTADAAPDQIVTISAAPAFLIGADAANYSATMPTEAVASIARATQVVSFSSVMPTPLLIGSTYAPTAVSSMGLIVTISLGAGSGPVCSLAAGVVTALTTGECVIVATQQGTADIEPAASVSQRVTVTAVDGAPPENEAAGLEPDTGHATSAQGDADGPDADAVHTVNSISGATSTGSPAPPTAFPIDVDGLFESTVSAAAVASEAEDRATGPPLFVLPLIALIGGGFFIAGKWRWSRQREA